MEKHIRFSLFCKAKKKKKSKAKKVTLDNQQIEEAGWQHQKGYVHAFQPTKVHGPSFFAECNSKGPHMHQRANGFSGQTQMHADRANSLVKISLTWLGFAQYIVPIGLEECLDGG